MNKLDCIGTTGCKISIETGPSEIHIPNIKPPPMIRVLSFYSKKEHYLVNLFACNDGWYEFTGDMDIDIDGSPDWQRDPCGQADTTLHYLGKPINGQKVPFIVLPPEVIMATSRTVLGCQAELLFNGNRTDAVVADVGPHWKAGEASPEAARRLGINDDPNHGGLDTPEVLFRFLPGTPAVVDGITYELKRYMT